LAASISRSLGGADVTSAESSFSVASIELLLALPLIVFGLVYGISTWIGASSQGLSATSGQVMIAALPILVGVQLLLAFLQYDIASTPDEPLSPMLEAVPRTSDTVDVKDPSPPA